MSLNNFHTTYGITDQTLQKLTKLQNLTQPLVSSKGMNISGVNDFIKNSLNIKTLKLYDKYINDTTIGAFIKRENNEPKIRFKFLSHYSRQKNKTNVSQNLIVL